jgi:hypothetical protein
MFTPVFFFHLMLTVSYYREQPGWMVWRTVSLWMRHSAPSFAVGGTPTKLCASQPTGFLVFFGFFSVKKQKRFRDWLNIPRYCDFKVNDELLDLLGIIAADTATTLLTLAQAIKLNLPCAESLHRVVWNLSNGMYTNSSRIFNSLSMCDMCKRHCGGLRMVAMELTPQHLLPRHNA